MPDLLEKIAEMINTELGVLDTDKELDEPFLTKYKLDAKN